jgi:hypothetical protein
MSSRIELRVEDAPDLGPVVRVAIDGRDLIDWIRKIELLHAREDGREDIAGAYAGLRLQEWADLPSLGYGRVAVLGCTCGEVGCWPLGVRIEIRPRTVIWRDILGAFSVEAIYEPLGRFIFDREQYEAEIARVLRHHPK